MNLVEIRNSENVRFQRENASSLEILKIIESYGRKGEVRATKWVYDAIVGCGCSGGVAMTHEEIQNRLSAYLDGELSANDQAAVESHLSECGICSQVLTQFRSVSSSLLRIANQSKVSESFKDRIESEIHTMNRRRVERFAGMLSGLAACLAIAAGVQLMRTSSASASSIAVPAAWEGVALQLSPSEENNSSATTSSDLALANFMVADLSEGHSSHE